MSFKDRPFSARFAAMGDEAESIFEGVYTEGWVRFGLNRPPINMSKLPPKLRYTPDYLTSKGLLEVQGSGRDQSLKLKCEKYAALSWWDNEVFKTDLFLWDAHNRRHGFLTLDELEGTGELSTQNIKLFPEGKTYWNVPLTELPIDWTEL